MDKRTLSLIAAVIILLLAGGYYFFWGDEDEDIIRQNLAKLVELAEKSGDESFFVGISQSREMLDYIAREPRIELGSPLPLLTDRQELEGIVIQARQSVQALSIRIIRQDLVMAEDRQSALMKLEAEGRIGHGGEDGRERREFLVDWIKEDGDWVIQKVELVGRF